MAAKQAGKATRTVRVQRRNVPVIGGSRPADVKYTRWVFVLGYLFGH